MLILAIWLYFWGMAATMLSMVEDAEESGGLMFRHFFGALFWPLYVPAIFVCVAIKCWAS